MCSRAFGICLLLWMDIHNVSKPAKHKTQTRTRTYRRSTKRPDQTTQPRNPTSADSVRLGGGLHDQQTTPGWPHAARPQTGSGGSCDSREPFSFLKLPRAIKGLIDWGKGGGAKNKRTKSQYLGVYTDACELLSYRMRGGWWHSPTCTRVIIHLMAGRSIGHMPSPLSKIKKYVYIQ